MLVNLFIAMALVCNADSCITGTSQTLFKTKAECEKANMAMRAELPAGLLVSTKCVLIEKIEPNGTQM